MEFLQVPETPAPQPVEPDVPDCCGEEKIGKWGRKTGWRQLFFFFFFKESSVYVRISLYYMLCLCIKFKMLSYRGWRNSQWWWWQQWLRRRWAQFEPGAQSTTESISGWWQSARQHCPQTQRYNAFVDIKLTSYYICVTAVDCVYDRQTKCFSFLFLVILSNVYLPYILHRV